MRARHRGRAHPRCQTQRPASDDSTRADRAGRVELCRGGARIALSDSSHAHHVVIVGAGFGGLEVAHRLAGAPVRITIIDQRNHHLFQPLLYQVATASLAPSEIAWPIRHVLRKHKEVTTLLAVVTGVDTEGCKVLLEDGGVVVYGTLVLATGARHAYFGHNEWNLTRPVSRHYRTPPPFAAGYFFPLNRPNVRPIRSVAPRCSPL